MTPLTKKIVIAVSVIVFAYVTTGYVLGRSSDDKAFHALTAYSEVLEHIQRDYVDDPNLHSVTSGALHGLLDSLDPQSGYMSPLEYTDYKEKSSNDAKGAAGMTLTKRFGYIGVVSALPDSPGGEGQFEARRRDRENRRLYHRTNGHRPGPGAAHRPAGDHREALRDSARQAGTSGCGHHAGKTRSSEARGGKD